MTNIIRKQIIDLHLDKGLDVYHIQNVISRQYRDDFLPDLGRLFDQVAPAEHIISIDKLEVDLGIFGSSDVEKSKWQEACLRAIAEALEKIRVEASDPGSVSEPEAFVVFRQWISYMKQGYLPWNASKPDGRWFDRVLEAIAVSSDLVSQLKVEIQRNSVLVSRIVAQHPKRFLWKMVSILTARKQIDLGRAVDEVYWSVNRHSPDRASKGILRISKDEIWQWVLRAAATEKAELSADAISKALNAWHGINTVVEEKRPATTEGMPEATRTDKVQINSSPGAVSSPDALDADEDVITRDGIFVESAGVVLLHPFLSTLFLRLKLVHENRFSNGLAQKKGIFLLHFLATGKNKSEEYELVIPKLLCSYPVDMPIGKTIRLSKKEIEEAHNLLVAAIAQWDVLKETSPAGLREGFLQRKGKLLRENEKLYLQVETSAIDVLIDRLPWNLSLVKLPWMKEMLRVEWR